jgi:hypothetical protein
MKHKVANKLVVIAQPGCCFELRRHVLRIELKTRLKRLEFNPRSKRLFFFRILSQLLLFFHNSHLIFQLAYRLLYTTTFIPTAMFEFDTRPAFSSATLESRLLASILAANFTDSEHFDAIPVSFATKT